MKIAKAILIILCLNRVAYADQPVLHQPLTQSEEELLNYFIDRCNEPLPPLTSFPIGFEHPMDVIACEVAEYYGKSSEFNHFLFSRGFYKSSQDSFFAWNKRNIAVGLDSFYAKGNMSLDTLIRGASLGDPNLIIPILSHPDRYSMTVEQRNLLTNYYPKSFLALALADLTQYNITTIIDLITPIVKNINQYSPNILKPIHPLVLNSLIVKQDRAAIYKELLELDKEKQMILLAYLSLLDRDSIATTEFLSIRRLLQSQLLSSKALTFSWSFDNHSSVALDSTIHALVNYLEALNYINRFFEFDPPYISAYALIDYLQTLRTQYPNLQEFDYLFPKASDFLSQLPTDFSSRAPAILSLTVDANELWEQNLLQLEASSQVLSNFITGPGQIAFSEKQKASYKNIYERYIADAPPFQRFFLKANYQSILHGFDSEGNVILPPINAFDSFIENNETLIANGCPFSTETRCFQFWSSFPLRDMLTGRINSLDNFACKFPDNLQLIGTNAAEYYVFPERFLASCDAGSLTKTMRKTKSISSFKENLWKTLIYPQPIGGVHWGLSHTFVTDDLGTLGAHLLKRSNKQNFPVTRDPFLVAFGADRTGWSYLLDLGNIPFPKTRDEQPDIGSRLVSNFEVYGTLQSAIGNVDKAFSAFGYSVTKNAEFLNEKPTVDFANLFFLGRSLGLPPDYLLQFMRESREGAKPYGSRPEDSIWEEFYKSYLADVDSLPLLPTIESLKGADDIDAYKKAAHIQGQLWRAKSQIKGTLCEIDSVREYVLDNGDKFPVRRPIDTSLYGGVFAYYELGNLDSICRVYDQIKLVRRHNGNIENSGYDEFLSESINPFITQGLNVSDVRYLDSIVAFAGSALIDNREFGAVISLAILKNIYVKLVNGYVTRNSDAMRYSQSKIEKALTTIGSQVLEIEQRNPRASQRPLQDKWMTLMLSAKHPLPSDKVRTRLIDNTAQFSQGLVDQHASAIKKLRLEISESQSIFDYLNVVAKFSENSLDDLKHFPFISARSFRNYNTRFETTSDIDLQFITIAGAGTAVSVLGIGRKREYFGDVINLKSNTQPIIDQIQAENQITLDLEAKICEVFKPVHELINKNLNLSGNTIFVSPSVNFYPIPIELVVGSGCIKTNTPIILVNDFAGAVAAERKLKSKEFPQRLYAVANPSLDDSNGFDNLISDIRGHRLNQVRSIDTTLISNLPPLPDAELEVDNVSRLFKTSKLLTGKNASISDTLVQAAKEPNSAVILATHGLPVSSEIDTETPALLSIENQKLGLVSSMDVYQYDLAGSTIMLSACDTAAGFVEDPTLMFTGFVKSFADAGADLIIASLWPVKSYASRVFSEEFFKEWKKSGQPFQAFQSAKSQITGPDRYPFVMIAP